MTVIIAITLCCSNLYYSKVSFWHWKSLESSGNFFCYFVTTMTKVLHISRKSRVKSLLSVLTYSYSYSETCMITVIVVWLGSLTVTCRTCNPEVTQRRRFDSALGHCRVTTLGKLFTHMCLCHQAV